MKLIVTGGMAIAVVFCVLMPTSAAPMSPMKRFKAQMHEKYNTMFPRKVIDGFAEMEVTHRNFAKELEKSCGDNAIRWYKEYGDYSALGACERKRVIDGMKALDSALGEGWGEYWKMIDDETRRIIVSDIRVLESFVRNINRARESENTSERLTFLIKHPNALALIDKYPGILKLVDADVAPAAFVLRKLKFDEMRDVDKRQVQSSLARPNAFLDIIKDPQLRDVFYEVPSWLCMMEPSLFSVTDDHIADLEINRNRIVTLTAHLETILERRACGLKWDEIVSDLNAILSYSPKRADLKDEDWMSLLLATKPESDKMMSLLSAYRHDRRGFETIERMTSTIMRDMNEYPPTSFCVLLKLIRKGSLIEDFELLVDICQEIGLKSKEGEYPIVMMILASAPSADDDFMHYLGKHRARLIAYLSDWTYGTSVEERWGRAKLNDLEDAKYDEGGAKKFIEKIPWAGGVLNVGIKLVEGYPVTTAEYLCAGIDVVGCLIDVIPGGTAGKEALKEGTKEVAKESAKKAAERIAKKTAKAIVKKKTKDKLKDVAKNVGNYIDENRDGIKDWAQRIAEFLDSYRNKNSHNTPANTIIGDRRVQREAMIRAFARQWPMREDLSLRCINAFGNSEVIYAPESYEKWVADFDKQGGSILLTTLEVK